MSALDWGDVFSGVSTLCAIAAVIYTRRVDQRQKTQDDPVVSFDLERIKEANCFQITLSARNPSRVDWELQRISFPRAKEARAALRSEGMRTDDYGGKVFDPEKAMKAMRPAPLALDRTIVPSDPGKAQASWPDPNVARVLFTCEPARKSISIRVVLRSKDARARTVTLNSRMMLTELRISAAV